MKRTFLPRILLVLSLIVLSTSVFAQDGGAPRPAASRTPVSKPGPTQNVYETLAARKDLAKFTEMVGDADLKSALTGAPDEPVTVFAPTNEALDEIPHDVMKRIKANQANLQNFVKYHFITNSLVSSSAIKGRKVSPASANGEALAFDGTSKKEPPKVNDGTLTEMDIAATNGVIHVVSTGLVPPSLKAEPPPPAPPKPATAPAAPIAPDAAAQPSVPIVQPANAPPIPGATGANPAEATTTGLPPAETTTGTVPEVPADAQQQPPPSPAQPDASQQPASDSKGFSVFGHKFGW